MRTPPKCVGGKRREKASCMDRHFVRRYAACAKERERERERRERERGERENEEDRQCICEESKRARARERERRERGEQPRQARRRTACLSARPCGDVQRNNGMLDAIVGALYGAVSAVAVQYVPLRLTRPPKRSATQSGPHRPLSCPKFVPLTSPSAVESAVPDEAAARAAGLRFARF